MEDDMSFVVQKSDFHNVLFALVAIVFIIGTTGNAISLSVILYYRRLRLRPFNIILMFLIVIDLISCSISILFQLTLVLFYVRNIPVNKIVCQISLFLISLGKFGSLMTMGEIAILRVIYLSNRTCAKKLVSKTSMTMIIILNIIVVPGWAAWKSFYHLDFCDAIGSQIKTEVSPAIEWCVFTPIIVLCYTGIACYTKTRAGQPGVQRTDRRVRYDIATIRTCIVIIFAFLICHLPFIVYIVVKSIKHVQSIDILEYTFYYQFHFFSQAGNPIIMFVTCQEFRKHVLMFLRFLFRRRCRQK